MNGSTAHRAAVITPGRAFFGNGTTAEIAPGLHRDLAGVLHGLPGRFTPDCTIVLDGVDLDTLRPSDAADCRWKFSELRAWTTFERDGQVASVGVRNAMTPGRQHHVLFGPSTDPGAVAMLLDRYHSAVGCAWRGTPAMSALALMRLTWGNPQNQPLWHHVEKGAGHAGPLVWTREPNDWETTWDYVHTFDANAAYLGSAINVEVAWGALHNTGSRPFDPRRPGYWLLQLDMGPGAAWQYLASPSKWSPPPLFNHVSKTGRACVTTPYVRLLAELGVPFEVVDSWTADRGVRVLRKWGELLRDARRAVEAWPSGGMRDAVLRAVKRTYTDAVGAMQRVRDDGGGMRVQRPDWAHTIVDLWRATLIRKVYRVRETEGVWPLHINTDALAYADVTDQISLGRAIGVRPGLGGWKHTDVAELGAWLAAHPVRTPRTRRERASVPA